MELKFYYLSSLLFFFHQNSGNTFNSLFSFERLGSQLWITFTNFPTNDFLVMLNIFSNVTGRTLNLLLCHLVNLQRIILCFDFLHFVSKYLPSSLIPSLGYSLTLTSREYTCLEGWLTV